MRKPLGLIRLPALPAPDPWHARTTLALYAVAPLSTVTVTLNAGGLRSGDVAGLVLFRRPHAWLGVERASDGLTLAQFDEQSGKTSRVPLGSRRVWLRAECDFVRMKAAFRYSTDGKRYAGIGEPCPMGDDPIAAQGIMCSLFACATKTHAEGHHADFDSFLLTTERARHQDGLR
jgi:xylan 1,4-beta-xylosidase